MYHIYYHKNKLETNSFKILKLDHVPMYTQCSYLIKIDLNYHKYNGTKIFINFY